MSLDRLVLSCPMTESQEVIISEGMAVAADTPDGLRLYGTIGRTEVDDAGLAAGLVIDAARRVRVVLRDEVPFQLIGTTVRAEVRIRGSEAEVLAVPSAALVRHPDGTAAVTVLRDHGDGPIRVTVPVTVGAASGGWIEVDSRDLASGDTVLLGTIGGS